MNESLARGVPTLPSARLRRAATSPQGEALNLRSSETVFSPSLFVFPVRQKRAVCPLPARGVGAGGAGGPLKAPAHRRASKASLEPERLAEPISRAKHRHAEWRDGAKQGGAQGPTPTGGRCGTEIEKYMAQWRMRRVCDILNYNARGMSFGQENFASQGRSAADDGKESALFPAGIRLLP